MAFIDHKNSFTVGAQTISFDARSPVGGAVQEAAPTDPARLSPLEWLVVAVAKGDRLSSLRAPGRLGRTLGAVFGASPNPGLADGRLEALRRIAVRLWRQGRDFDGPEIPAFLAAGYSPAQFSLVAASIDAARSNRNVPA